MDIVAVIFIRVRHTGVKEDGSPNLGSVTLYDLDEITIAKNRERYVPVPVGATVDIPMSSRTFVSYSKGSIHHLVNRKLITAEVHIQLRDKQHCGGLAGTGQQLRPGVLNFERVNNTLRLVIPDIVLPGSLLPTNLGSVGFVECEPISITGFVFPFRSLNGDYVISQAIPGQGLAGAESGSYLLEMPSEGPNIAPQILSGLNLCLTKGRITVACTSNGDVLGQGQNFFGYVAGQLLPMLATGGGGGGMGVNVWDEGIPLPGNPYTILNFIGPDVLALDSGNPSQANIYIPPPTFLSHWNANDGSNGAQFVSDSTPRVLTRISTPAGGEGNPFFTNGWAGTNQDTTISTASTHTTSGNTTGFGGDSTMTVVVYSANGTTVLDSFTTPSIVGNGVLVSPSGRLTVTITGFAPDLSRFQANASVNVNVAGVFTDSGLEGGRYHIEITHTTDTLTDGTGPYTFVQTDVFYDVNPTTPAINGTVGIAETAGGQVVKHLSGLEYYILGSLFTVDVNDIDQLNRDTQRIPTNLQINGPEYGLPQLNQAGFGAGAANFVGWSNNHNQDNIGYLNTAWGITAANYRYLGPTGNVFAFPQDPWANGGAVGSPNASILVDTFLASSTALFRDYNDEVRRQQENHNSGLPLGNWNSLTDLNTIQYPAQGAVRVLAAPVVPGDTFTIGATVFTAAAGPRTPGANDFDGTLGTVAALQTELIAAINDPLNGAAGFITASAGLPGDVRLTAVSPGAAGNSIALSTTAPLRLGVSDTSLWRGGVPAQVWNSRLVVPSATTLVRSDGPNSPNANWTGYSPSTLGPNPNYTALTAPAVAFETFQDTSGLFRSSGQMLFTGTFAGGNALADLVSGALEVYIFKVGGVGNSGPLPVNTRPLLLFGPAYNFATFDDGLTDGQIREASSVSNTINFTFGGFSMLGGIHVAWVINNPLIQIDSVTTTFF